MTLPPRLEHYLPPGLWRRLTADVPRRGALLNALDRLRSILYHLSTYLPRHLVEEKMRRPVPGQVHGQILNGSLLFADVSGFTALSERLAILDQEAGERPSPRGPKGAEQLTDLMNRYFERMIDIIAQSDGILLKFAGDALLVYFPEQKNGEQARWAVRAGQRMMRAMADFAAMSLQMKIGIGTGHFLAASVGDVERMEYVILGETVTRTMAAEGVAEVGQVVADAATFGYLDPGCPPGRELPAGFRDVRCDTAQALDDFEIMAERRRVRGAIPLSAQPHAIATQMEIALRQIEVVAPYLPPELVADIVARAQPGKRESEYRPATVLFLNVTGLEALLSDQDGQSQPPSPAHGPQAQAMMIGQDGQPQGLPLRRGQRENPVQRVTRLLNDYFQVMHKIIVEHGGVVSRIDPYRQGSKMLVLFGAPLAPEDGPQRAVSAALNMNAELAALNGRWGGRVGRFPVPGDLADSTAKAVTTSGQAPRQILEGPLLQQRIGITRGETFAGQVGSATRREYTVMGDDVNLAARLMAAAQPGQILLSQRVYDAVADRFLATALPPIQVKGKSRPIPVYQPTGLRDNPLARRLRSRGPLFGRDAELKQGLALLRQALAGQGAVLTITGPAGVGKSHLADELAAQALARGARLLFTACQPHHTNAPYAPWIALVQNLVAKHITPADDPDARREKLVRSLEGLDLSGQEFVDPLCDLLGLPTTSLSTISPLPGSSEGHVADSAGQTTGTSQASPPSKPTLFTHMEQKVASQEQKGLNLWHIVQDRPQAQAGQTWAGKGTDTLQTLQARVAARRQEQLCAAVGGLLASLSSTGPLLCMFESAQWMDTASQALLGYLEGRLRQNPILFLVLRRSAGPACPTRRRGERAGEERTFKDDAAGIGEPCQEAGKGTGPLGVGTPDTLSLGPLSMAGTAAMIHRLLATRSERTQGERTGEDRKPGREEGGAADGLPELAQALVEPIHQQSGGNPLFVEEIVRWVQRSGYTTVEGLKGGLQASITLQELVLTHLDSLPHGQRDVGSLASIAGVEFSHGAVRALLPASTSDAALDEHLSGLESAGLILRLDGQPIQGAGGLSGPGWNRGLPLRQASQAVGQDDADARYAFRQTLVREVVYSSQSFARRRELHARMAAFLEARHADDLVQHAELLAHHYELGACPLPAARYLVLSGQKAVQRYACTQAADYYGRALTALDLLSPGEVNAESLVLRAQAHEGQGDVAVLTGDLAAAARAYEAAHTCLAGQVGIEIPATLLLKLMALEEGVSDDRTD